MDSPLPAHRPVEREVITICESRRPLSALDLHLNTPPNHFLQPGDVPQRPASMIGPGQSPVQSSERLHPYYTHSNGSQSSSISIGIQSSSDLGRGRRGRHVEVAHPRPDALPTSRAAARGITRVATRAPSRATSCSRNSRAMSRTPIGSIVDLPATPHIAPPSSLPAVIPESTTHGTQPTLAVPDAVERSAVPTPDSLRLTTASLVEQENVYPITDIPRYDSFDTISPDRGHWKLDAVTTHFPM